MLFERIKGEIIASGYVGVSVGKGEVKTVSLQELHPKNSWGMRPNEPREKLICVLEWRRTTMLATLLMK